MILHHAFHMLICYISLNLVEGSVNLVLPSDEVRKLLGLTRELAYIRNGVVNTNAVNFPIPVSTDLDSIHFMWFNPDPTLQVNYKLVINLMSGTDPESDPDVEMVMHQPFVNISHSGLIPTTPTIWRVALPCSGHKSATVDIYIDLTLFGSLGGNFQFDNTDQSSDKKAQPSTKLRLKRSKTCSGDDPKDSLGGLGKTGSGGVWKSDLAPSTPPHMVFLGALLSAIIVIVLLVICLVIIHMRSRNKIPRVSKTPKASGPTASATTTTTFMQQPPMSNYQQAQQHIYEPIPALPPPHPQYQNSMGSRGLFGLETRPGPEFSNFQLRQRYIQGQNFEMGLMSDAAESRVTDWIQQQQREQMEDDMRPVADPQTMFESLQVDRSRLKLGSLLQEGTFGRVYQGVFECEDGSEQDVMIKTVLTGSAPNQCQMLIIEGVRLQSVIPANKNVLQLLAATWDGTSPMLIYPYSAQGNFKQYLTQFAAGGLSTHQVVRMGIHLLAAIGHLHKRGIIHKDIAARNCFLAEGPTLKLADNALSRDLFPNDYHCLGDNENRPIKWMPLEAIAQGVFSRSSDIWSFGIVLWELMTRAQQPYPEIDPFEMEAYLSEGYRLPQPMNCPDQLFSVLVSCWGTRPPERTSLQQLHQSLQALQRQLQQFV